MDIDTQLSDGIKKLAKKASTTEYMIFMAALMVMLSKYSRQEDVVIGSPISGRTHRDTEKMIGMFVNTLAMRGRPEGDKTFEEFLEEIKQTALNAYENQEYPFEELVEAVEVRRDMSRNPIFDVMLTMQNDEGYEFNFDGIKVFEINDDDENIAKFDLSYDISEINGRFVIAMEYSIALFTEETAKNLLAHYEELLRNAVKSSSKKISELRMITSSDIAAIDRFNATDCDYPKDKTVIRLLEEKSEEIPDRTALQFDGAKETFCELNEKANRLGMYLRNKGIGKNDFVLLIAERSLQMLEAIYGILKSGGAYVPVDQNTPDERIKFMIGDCGAKAVVTYGVELTVDTDVEIVRYEDIDKLPVVSENLEILTGPKDLAYMIYTSGTTGQPKGVMIEHQGLVNLLSPYEKIYGMTKEDVVLQFASYCFDQSVWDIFSIVWSGNTVCAIPADYVRNPEKLAEYMKQEGITLTSLTPAYINILEPKNFESLRLLDSSGEAGNLDTLKKWCRAGKRVINTYGPTEVTVNLKWKNMFQKITLPFHISHRHILNKVNSNSANM